MASSEQLTQWIRTACLMEVTAPKPGNVHPQASFDDVTYADFVRSAEVVAPVLARAGELGVGWAMHESVRATQQAVGTNTNLGMIVLLAPLAAVPLEQTLSTGIGTVLERLTVEDARHCYAAIRLASPGGLGRTDTADVADEPALDLVEAMTLAAHRDRVAAQYANRFKDVVGTGLDWLSRHYAPEDWRTSVVRLHLSVMAECPDTLIARKCGREIAEESALRAQKVLNSVWPESDDGCLMIESFDAWLRADGHRRNPGTSADLVAAILFAGLREGFIQAPAEIDQL